jgi:2-polyprenyl-6-hydroxyphenyl methylase/3-demethylubiquinone-9 3-methyltransferase
MQTVGAEAAGLFRRVVQGSVRRLRGAAVGRGLARYRRIDASTPDEWDREYAARKLDFYAEIHELARYSIIVGYVRYLGGARSMLDIGCGEGLLASRLAPDDFERYTGIDTAPSAIARAKRLENDRVTFLVSDWSSPGLGTFDFVVCNEILYYVEDPDVMLEHLREVLEPGGYLLSSVWRHPGDSALHRMINERFRLIDAVELRNGTARAGMRCRVMCHQRATS